MTNTSHTFGMTNTSHTFGMTFSLSFRRSVSDERSFAYAQDDKGKEFGRIFLLFLSFRGTIVTRNLILTSNKSFCINTLS